MPDAAKNGSNARKRKCKKSEILTSSLYKIAVEEKENGKVYRKIKRKKWEKSLEQQQERK